MRTKTLKTLSSCLLALLAAASVSWSNAKRSPVPDPYAAQYKGYNPGFSFPSDMVAKDGTSDDPRKLSSEPNFYTLNLLPESSRANALVTAAMNKEAEGEFSEAADIYQQVIDEYSDSLYRVSEYGVFVPITTYCQLRLLGFPSEALRHYRTKHDARAQQAFDLALQRNSVEGLTVIRDTMLATTYGGRAMLALGDMALDRGHYLEALEYYESVQRHFPDRALHTPELLLKTAYARKMLGDSTKTPRKTTGQSQLAPDDLKAFQQFVVQSKRPESGPFSQMASEPHPTTDDYGLMPPTLDPMGIAEPVWRARLPGTREGGGSYRGSGFRDVHVYTQPVVTDDSVLYRHKNAIYSHSLLNGALRWRNDLGGRVEWQSASERQLPMEDLLVQDGMVFTALYNVGPTLVALDEITGRLRWAYGPMVASTTEEANLRFEAAPAGGPMSVFVGYVLDNIEGDTHTDTEYGIMAFESTTGRLRWRRVLGRMRPGLFAAGFSEQLRNRIRSFMSPPLYHEGTVYYTTNAGTIAALDALSGQIKWIMRHPYLSGIHDATRRYQGPTLWYNHRPLLIGDALYVTPVNSRDMYRLDRRTGRVIWSKPKAQGLHGQSRRTDGGRSWFLGPTSSGELAVVYSFRDMGKGWQGPEINGGIHLLDPKTGKTVWESGDLITLAQQPVLKHRYGDGNIGFWALGANGWTYTTTARPFMTDDDKIYMGGYYYYAWPIWDWSTHLTEVCLKERKALNRRRYIGGRILAYCDNAIRNAHTRLKLLEDLPHKDDKIKEQIQWLKEIQDDSVPVNEHGPFLPFSRITFDRFGQRFEFRMGSREIAMLYPRTGVRKTLAARTEPTDLFARAELAVADNQLDEAAQLMRQCLAAMSSEDLDFRAMVNQQLYQVYKRLARGAVRTANTDAELAHCIGMSRTVGTLDDEIETMFALSEAYRRQNDLRNAARQAQNIIATYGHYEAATPSILYGDMAALTRNADDAVDKGLAFAGQTLYRRELTRSMALLKKGLPLYFSALSPLEKDLTVRAGEMAAGKLFDMRSRSAEFAGVFEKEAEQALTGKPIAEQLARLQEFPATAAAQKTLDALLADAGAELGKPETDLAGRAALRRQMWTLADQARIARLTLPPGLRERLAAPERTAPPAPLAGTVEDKSVSFEEERGPAWLVLERRGRHDIEPGLVFLGGRVRTRFDHKFLLYAVDMKTGVARWKATEQRGETWFDELRLDGLGDEPGFFEAFVRDDTVVVHGRYDVLAFRLKDGTLKWRYRVPFAFEIRNAVESGDLLILAGQSETVALYLDTEDPRGEVVWQEREEGDLYIAPWLHGDRLISVRRLPFNLTVRYRGTGKLIGRLSLPDLTLEDEHPLWEEGPRALPSARDGRRLLLSDGDYWLMIDVELIKIVWKRLIDNNDPAKLPPMRFAMNGDYTAIVKQDFNVKTIYMLSSETGDILWNTDPKDRKTPQPMHSMFMRDGKLYGLRLHPGQGFYLVGLDCATGKALFRQNEQKDYVGKPDARLLPTLYGGGLAVLVRDRQDFEVKAFGAADGQLLHTVKVKASGDFGEHGRASATVQNGGLFLLGGHELVWTSSR